MIISNGLPFCKAMHSKCIDAVTNQRSSINWIVKHCAISMIHSEGVLDMGRWTWDGYIRWIWLGWRALPLQMQTPDRFQRRIILNFFYSLFVRPPFYTITNHQRGTGISLVQIAFCMRSENRFTINSLIWHSERGWRIRHPGMMKSARKSGRPMRMTTFDCLNLAARLSIGITYRSLTCFEFLDLWWVASWAGDMQGASSHVNSTDSTG